MEYNVTDIIKQNQQNKTYASIPFWNWNDKLEEEELSHQIRNICAAVFWQSDVPCC